MSDLVRAMQPVPEGLRMEFIRASSYGSGTRSSGRVAVTGMGGSVRGRHVLLVSTTEGVG